MELYKKILIKSTAFIIAFQILNMSIDSPNARGNNYYKGADNFNYIDTYIEYVSEVILNYENAIPESGKTHQKQWQQHKLYQVICDTMRYRNDFALYYPDVKEVFFTYNDTYAYQFIKEISPPPKSIC